MSNELTFSSTSRFFWKTVCHLFKRQSQTARIIRTRRIKRQMPYDALQRAIWHALTIFEYFNPNIDLLFLGSSHTVYGIAPKNFKTLQALNAGFNSGDAKLAYYTYQALRDQWPKAPRQAVVMSDDSWIGAHQIEFTSEFYHAILVKHFTQMPYDSNFLIAVHDRFVARHIHQLRNESVPESVLAEKGFITHISVQAAGNTPEGIASRVHGHVKRAFFEPTQLRYLSALRKAVEADGRQLIFLRFPVREDYLTALDSYPEKVWEPTESVRKGCPLLDYFRIPLPLEAWVDVDHLSEFGARQFTELIEAQLLTLLKSPNKHLC